MAGHMAIGALRGPAPWPGMPRGADLQLKLPTADEAW